MIEGLSRLIIQAKDAGRILGMKVTKSHNITHLLFVDDVLLFGIGQFAEWLHFKYILDWFCLALGMVISAPKSRLYHI